MTMEFPVLNDIFTTLFLHPKAQGISKKNGWKHCKNQTSAIRQKLDLQISTTQLPEQFQSF